MRLMFPGTFDPFTFGHADIVAKAFGVADSVVVAIGVNDSKQPMFTVSERLEAIKEYYVDNPKVLVIEYQGLTFEAAKRCGASCIVRGVRSCGDFEYERDMAIFNQGVGGIGTMLFISDPGFSYVSAGLARQMISLGQPVDKFVIETFKNKTNKW